MIGKSLSWLEHQESCLENMLCCHVFKVLNPVFMCYTCVLIQCNPEEEGEIKCKN